MQVNDGDVGTDFFDRSFEGDALALDVEAFFFQFIGDHQRSHGAEEATIGASEGFDGDGDVFEFLGFLLRIVDDVLLAVLGLRLVPGRRR